VSCRPQEQAAPLKVGEVVTGFELHLNEVSHQGIV
jgi:hypothetical protein